MTDHDDDTCPECGWYPDEEWLHSLACPGNDDGPMDDDWIEADLDATYRAIAYRERLWEEARMGHLK